VYAHVNQGGWPRDWSDGNPCATKSVVNIVDLAYTGGIIWRQYWAMRLEQTTTFMEPDMLGTLPIILVAGGAGHIGSLVSKTLMCPEAIPRHGKAS
jgi:hypothetical protein